MRTVICPNGHRQPLSFLLSGGEQRCPACGEWEWRMEYARSEGKCQRCQKRPVERTLEVQWDGEDEIGHIRLCLACEGREFPRASAYTLKDWDRAQYVGVPAYVPDDLGVPVEPQPPLPAPRWGEDHGGTWYDLSARQWLRANPDSLYAAAVEAQTELAVAEGFRPEYQLRGHRFKFVTYKLDGGKVRPARYDEPA